MEWLIYIEKSFGDYNKKSVGASSLFLVVSNRDLLITTRDVLCILKDHVVIGCEAMYHRS